jgi:hypothetical protein
MERWRDEGMYVWMDGWMDGWREREIAGINLDKPGEVLGLHRRRLTAVVVPRQLRRHLRAPPPPPPAY